MARSSPYKKPLFVNTPTPPRPLKGICHCEARPPIGEVGRAQAGRGRVRPARNASQREATVVGVKKGGPPDLKYRVKGKDSRFAGNEKGRKKRP